MAEATTFLLVVARLSGLFLLAPVFNSSMLPMQIKIITLLVLAAMMTPMVAHGVQLPDSQIMLVVLIVKEALIGLVIGFAVALVFSAVQMGASFIDTSIGFSLASVFDPTTNSQSSVLGTFYTTMATLIYLAINGHHWLLLAFARSFEAMPITSMPNVMHMMNGIQSVVSNLLTMAFQIAAPVLVTLLLVDIVLGVLSRVVPQMNVFFVGIPLKIAVGLMAIIISLPVFDLFLQHRLSDVFNRITALSGA